MEVIATNKEYILVNIDNAKLNIDGILSRILDKSYLKYKILPDHWTIFNSTKSSYLGHIIDSLISFGISNNGIWYDNQWTYKKNNENYHGIFDSLFYDEFIFLLSEDLIQFDDYTFLTMDDIWSNFESSYLNVDESFLKDLYDCKNISDLKTVYKKLVLEYHPDITGSDNDEIRMITSTYLKIRNSL